MICHEEKHVYHERKFVFGACQSCKSYPESHAGRAGEKIQFMGEENMTSLIISRIEKNQRHVCDAELRLLAKALEVSMEWLVGDLPLFPL